MQLLQRIAPSLVEVRTVNSRTMTRSDGHTGVATYHTQGFGIIIESDGLIVTNTHIINGAEHIYVGTSDGKIFEARRVYSSNADFSFIKIDAPNRLEPITWADSSAAAIGTPVIALAIADDGQHVVGGAITNLVNGIDSAQVELLELDINLEQGDSGGPLLDTQGHLLGIIMAKRLNEGNKSYAIASNKIQFEYNQFQQQMPN